MKTKTAVLFVLLTCSTSQAQPPPGKRIIDRETFDKVTFLSGRSVDILPLSTDVLPNRRPPDNPPGNRNVRLRMLKDPAKEFGVLWKRIKRIETFEMMILAEAESITDMARKSPVGTAAERRTKLARFDAVYHYFAFLKRKHGKFPPKGMDAAFQRYLYFNSLAFNEQERTLRAFSLLEELYSLNNKYTTNEGGPNEIIPAINAVVKTLVADLVRDKQFGDARDLISRMQLVYTDKLSTLAESVKTLSSLAAVHRDVAQKHLTAKKFREAHVEVRKMLTIWPRVAGGQAVAVESARQFPQVVVAVNELPNYRKMDDFANWSARRTGRLVERMLYEAYSPGSEGAVYRCPVGKFDKSEDREELTQFAMKMDTMSIHKQRPPLTGFDLSRRMIERANPMSKKYDRSWAAAFGGVEVKGVVGLHLVFRRPHILPPAIMRISLKPQSSVGSFGPYQLVDSKPTQHTYAVNPNYGLFRQGLSYKPPSEIIEQHFKSRDEAIRQLREGAVDVIDRLYPGDALQLIKESDLVVKSYGFPTVHVLLPNLDRPYPNNWNFRKAVLFAIDREVTLRKGILLDQKGNLPGCRVISGPFPTGLTDNDPLGYGYDPEILPRLRRPRVSIALKALAESQIAKAAAKKKEKVPTFNGVTIAHPPTDLARTVCRLMAQQLDRARLKCTLKELKPGESSTNDPNVDFTYAELTPWEPLVDARRMLGPKGLAPAGGTRVELALQRLDKAKDWEQAGARLKDVHRMAYNDVSVIPLWQITNYFAHHKGVTGIRAGAAWLYEDVELWKITPRIRK